MLTISIATGNNDEAFNRRSRENLVTVATFSIIERFRATNILAKKLLGRRRQGRENTFIIH